jgi:RNA polymerase sigma-70 factor (ECF subfamily)
VKEPVQLVREGEQQSLTSVESFEAFVLENHTRLYGALCLLTKDRYEAEEIAQEAFVRILERWDRVRLVEDPTGYLFRTALNVYRKRFRRALIAVRRAAAVAPTDDFVERIEASDLVVRAIAELPADQRAALIVTSLLGYSSDEAARILSARPSTVRARATRARSALREAIGEER